MPFDNYCNFYSSAISFVHATNTNNSHYLVSPSLRSKIHNKCRIGIKRRTERDNTIQYNTHIHWTHYILRASLAHDKPYILQWVWANALHNVIVGSNEPLSKCWHCQIEKERAAHHSLARWQSQNWIERDKRRGTDSHTYSKPFKHSTAALQFPFVQFHCSGAFFARLIHFLTLCLSLAYCCFCKLHRTIILVWLHFGDIHTCFSLSFDFMPGEKIDSNSRSAFVFVQMSDSDIGSIYFSLRRHQSIIKQIRQIRTQ